MKEAITLLFLLALGWYAYSHHQRAGSGSAHTAEEPASFEASSPAQFRCDGRTMCSQMTSCAEATFFLQNCPNTEMDGDRDGIPCERQWCN